MAINSGAGTDHGGGTHDDHSRGYGGEGGNNRQQRPPAQIINQPTVRSQVFHIKCTGMKPDTLHKFFYEGQDLSSACMPIDPKPPGNTPIRYGSPLVTDEGGQIQFKFHFTVSIERQVDAANKTKYEIAGDKKFSLQAVNSTASKIVPYPKHKRPKNWDDINRQNNQHGYQPPTGNQH